MKKTTTYTEYKKDFINFARKKEKDKEDYPVVDLNNLLDVIE